MRVALASPVASKVRCHAQFAALPWRMTNGSLEILLITTLKTRRWIVPKGWPIDALAPHACAAREALEEAGVSGTVCEKAIGSFRYLKRRKDGEMVPCKVDVFALEVTDQRRTWAEKSVREFRWCTIDEALSSVAEPGLRQIISRFAQNKLVSTH